MTSSRGVGLEAGDHVSRVIKRADVRLVPVKRDLGEGYELDDDHERIDLAAVHAYISNESYWAKGRALEAQAEMNRAAGRLVGLYKDGRQVGFTRTALVAGMHVAYL